MKTTLTALTIARHVDENVRLVDEDKGFETKPKPETNSTSISLLRLPQSRRSPLTWILMVPHLSEETALRMTYS